jgi:hypothetical protein
MLTVYLPSTLQEGQTYSSSYSQPRTTWSCVQIYCPTALHALKEPLAPTEHEARCAPKPRCTFWIKDRTFTPSRIEPQIIGCTNHCLVNTMRDPSRFQHVTKTVLVRAICFMAATINFKTEPSSLFVCEKR